MNLKKKNILILILGFILSFFGFGCEENEANIVQPVPDELNSVVVAEHIDGDTFNVVFADGDRKTVRLIGIDTPEKSGPYTEAEPWGKEASKYVQELVPLGKTVYLQKDVSDADPHGRLLRYVWLNSIEAQALDKEVQKSMLNALLLIEGMAQARSYPPDVSYDELFQRLEQEARLQKKGMWQDVEEENFYVGNLRSKVFHRPDCESVKEMKEDNKIIFSSYQEAKEEGYEPCGACQP